MPIQVQAHCKAIFVEGCFVGTHHLPPSLQNRDAAMIPALHVVWSDCAHVSEFSHHSVSVSDITLEFCRIYWRSYFISWLRFVADRVLILCSNAMQHLSSTTVAIQSESSIHGCKFSFNNQHYSSCSMHMGSFW